MLEHLICHVFLDNYYYWRFHGKVSSSHDMLNENFGFGVSENLHGEDSYLRKKGMTKLKIILISEGCIQLYPKCKKVYKIVMHYQIILT